MSVNKKIALFIDCENISHEYLEDIFNELPNYGEATIRQAYADWSKASSRQWRNRLNEFGIQSVDVQPNIPKKNASDMLIVIKIMETIFKRTVDAIVLVSSDSDFTSIATKVREEGLEMIGFGEAKTSKSFRNTCSSFIELPVKKIDKFLNTKHLWQILKHAISSTQKNEGYALVSQMGSYLKNQSANYIPKNYGGNSWSNILKNYPEKFELFFRDQNHKTLCVKVKD